MARKGYSSSNKEKIIYDNTVFRGVSATTDPNPEGYFKQLINFDISDTGQSLQPRKGFINTVFHTKDNNGYHYVNFNYDSTIYYLDHETGKYYLIDFSKHHYTPGTPSSTIQNPITINHVAEYDDTIENDFRGYVDYIESKCADLLDYLNDIPSMEIWGETIDYYISNSQSIPDDSADDEVIAEYTTPLFSEDPNNPGIYRSITDDLQSFATDINGAFYFNSDFKTRLDTYYNIKSGSTAPPTSTELLQMLGLYDQSNDPGFNEWGELEYGTSLREWFLKFFDELDGDSYLEYIKNHVSSTLNILEDILFKCYDIDPEYIEIDNNQTVTIPAVPDSYGTFVYKVDLTQIDKSSKYFIVTPITDIIEKAKPEEDIIYLQDYLGSNYTDAVLQTIKPVGPHKATYIKDGMLIDRNIIKVECKLLNNNVPTTPHQFWLEFKYNDTSDEMLLTVVNTDDTKDLLERNIASPKSVIPDPIAKVYSAEEDAFNDGVTYSKFPMIYKYKDIINSNNTTTRKYLINYTDNLEGLTIAPSFYLLPPKPGYKWVYTYDIYSTSNLLSVYTDNDTDKKTVTNLTKYEAFLYNISNNSMCVDNSTFMDLFQTVDNYLTSGASHLTGNYDVTFTQLPEPMTYDSEIAPPSSAYDHYYYSIDTGSYMHKISDKLNVAATVSNSLSSLVKDCYIVYIMPKNINAVSTPKIVWKYSVDAYKMVEPERLIYSLFINDYNESPDQELNSYTVANITTKQSADHSNTWYYNVIKNINTINDLIDIKNRTYKNDLRFFVQKIEDIAKTNIFDEGATLYNSIQTALNSGVIIFDSYTKMLDYEDLYKYYLKQYDDNITLSKNEFTPIYIRGLYTKSEYNISCEDMFDLEAWYSFVKSGKFNKDFHTTTDFTPTTYIRNIELFFPNLFDLSDSYVAASLDEYATALYNRYTVTPAPESGSEEEQTLNNRVTSTGNEIAKTYYVYTSCTDELVPKWLAIYNGKVASHRLKVDIPDYRSGYDGGGQAFWKSSSSYIPTITIINDLLFEYIEHLVNTPNNYGWLKAPLNLYKTYIYLRSDGALLPINLDLGNYIPRAYYRLNKLCIPKYLTNPVYRSVEDNYSDTVTYTHNCPTSDYTYTDSFNISLHPITYYSIIDSNLKILYYEYLPNNPSLFTLTTTQVNNGTEVSLTLNIPTRNDIITNLTDLLYSRNYFDNGLMLSVYFMQLPESYTINGIDVSSLCARSKAIASTNLFNSMQIQFKENADNDDTNIIDEALDGADEDPAIINECTEWCIFNSLEGYRLVVWSRNNVYMSEAGDYNYFKSANKKVYPEPVVKVLAFKDMLLVFTTQNMYSIFTYEITEQVQDGTDDEGNPKYVQQKRTIYNTLPVLYNLYTDERYKDVIQVYNGMILFYSADGQLYLISPSTQIDTDTQFTLKYINKSVNDVLLNYDKYINERLNLYYNTHDFEYVTKNKNNNDEYDVIITASVSISNIKIYYTVPKYTYTYILIYDITNNRYTIYDTATFGTAQSILQTNMYDLVITKSPSNTLSAVIPYTEPNVADNNCDLTTVDNYTFIQHDIMTELDTGIIYLNNQWKKRFRSLQTTYKNIDANDLLFNLDVIVDDIFISSTMGDTLVLKNIDASNREALYYIAENRDERADLVRNPNVKEEDLVKNIPVNKITPSEFLKNNQKLFDFSSYSSNKIITHYTNIPSLGKHIELRLRFNSKGKYKLQGFTLVYKEHSV